MTYSESYDSCISWKYFDTRWKWFLHMSWFPRRFSDLRFLSSRSCWNSLSSALRIRITVTARLSTFETRCNRILRPYFIEKLRENTTEHFVNKVSKDIISNTSIDTWFLNMKRFSILEWPWSKKKKSKQKSYVRHILATPLYSFCLKPYVFCNCLWYWIFQQIWSIVFFSIFMSILHYSSKYTIELKTW